MLATAHSSDGTEPGLWQEMGDRWRAFWAIPILGRIKAYQGDFAAARAFYEQSLARAREFNDDWLYAYCLEGLASVVAKQGKCAWAAHLLGRGRVLARALRHPPYAS